MRIILFSFTITVMFLIFYIISRDLEKGNKVKKRIDSYVQLRDPREEELAALKEKFNIKTIFTNSLTPIKNRFRKYYNNTMPSQREEEILRRLLRAGNPFKMTVADYVIINNLIRVIVPLLFGAMGLLLKIGIFKTVILIVIGIAISIKTLDLYIFLKEKERNQKALREMPDFLDILTISVEAGLGFDLALSKTIEKRSGILCSEFNICLEEMRLGKMRRDALIGVKDRLAFDEMISFINSIIQSERLGTGIVQTLRAKSEDERDKRKQRAEEQAMKTTIKIILPLIFCIFPSIFIIILGPIAIQILKAFGN